jgi:hypothetical protein
LQSLKSWVSWLRITIRMKPLVKGTSLFRLRTSYSLSVINICMLYHFIMCIHMTEIEQSLRLWFESLSWQPQLYLYCYSSPSPHVVQCLLLIFLINVQVTPQKYFILHRRLHFNILALLIILYFIFIIVVLGYSVIFTKFLTIYHSWIYPFHHFPLSLLPPFLK